MIDFLQHRILIIGDHCPDVLHMAHAVEAIAPTTVAQDDEARTILARFDVAVVVIDGATSLLGPAEVATLRPMATRVLLASGAPPAEASADRELAILPAPADPHAVQAFCRLGLRTAQAARTARDLAYRHRRAHGLERPGTPAAEDLDGFERYEGLFTRSPAMRPVLAVLRAIESSDTTVLVCGEPGTGKELVAQAIHARSRRRDTRFVAVDLGALPAAERQHALFGPDGTSGLLWEAHGGCLFIDQVESASPALQRALLELVDGGVVMPTGGDRPLRVDVRVIAATTRDLDHLAREGRFHPDLAHHLRLCTVELPPVRARPEDIFPLASLFLARTSLAMGRIPPGISREARAALEAAPWEGNVRELQNAMERAAIRCRSGLVIAVDLPVGPPGAAAPGYSSPTTITIPPGGATLRQLERELFQKTLALAGGNQSRAAQILGLCESTFRFRLQKLGIASRRAAPASVTSLTSAPLTARA